MAGEIEQLLEQWIQQRAADNAAAADVDAAAAELETGGAS